MFEITRPDGTKVFSDGGEVVVLGGRLKTRDWARIGTGSQRVRTTYTYGFEGTSKHGDLVQVAYSNDPASTPQMSYNYDRRGRRSSIARDGVTTFLSYNDADQTLQEYQSGGLLHAWNTLWTYDDQLRRTKMRVRQSATVHAEHDYSYDNASRLATVTDNTGSTPYSATYDYLANSSLIGQITFRENTTERMTTTRQYDFLNRLASISAAASDEPLPLAYHYTYNNANQRIRTTMADGSFWVYDYDALGQVRSGKRFWSDGSPVPGQQFEYAHDDIGNRSSMKKGGDQNGANLRTTTYTVNNLNQYTARTTPGFVEVQGIANPLASLTLNSSSFGIYRRGEYFRRELSVSNSSGPVRQNVSVVASYDGQSDDDEGGIYLPRASETSSHRDYDADGNLIDDSLWYYVWDAENRLIEMGMKSGTGISGADRKRMVFDYDWKDRRVQKRVYHHAGGGWETSPAEAYRFMYDDWNLVAVLDQAPLYQSFMWGLDLSGSLQGAGGVGGLLMVTQHEPSETHHLVAHDGNGNVVGLVSTSTEKWSARYEYGPFGEPVRVTGEMADLNPVRFSTKFMDTESGFYYYGYRFYDPSTGRWPNRDPIGERGGLNLYRFVDNNPTSYMDLTGLVTITAGPDQGLGEAISDFFNPNTSNSWRFIYPHIVAMRFQQHDGVKWLWDFFYYDFHTYCRYHRGAHTWRGQFSYIADLGHYKQNVLDMHGIHGEGAQFRDVGIYATGSFTVDYLLHIDCVRCIKLARVRLYDELSIDSLLRNPRNREPIRILTRIAPNLPTTPISVIYNIQIAF